MTLEEAISNSETMKTNPLAVSERRRKETMQLGIEALKSFKDLQDRGALPPGTRLPSETEE